MTYEIRTLRPDGVTHTRPLTVTTRSAIWSAYNNACSFGGTPDSEVGKPRVIELVRDGEVVFRSEWKLVGTKDEHIVRVGSW